MCVHFAVVPSKRDAGPLTGNAKLNLAQVRTRLLKRILKDLQDQLNFAWSEFTMYR